jgi:integrase
MSKLKLTIGRIRDLTLPDGKRQVIFRDSEVPGLGVRVTTGSKSFVFQGKIAGQDLRITIGDVRIWLLDNPDPTKPGARQEARRLQALIDKGFDPRIEKAEQLSNLTKAKAREAKQGITVKDAWDDYVETHIKLWSASHVRGHQQAVMGKRTTGPLFELMDLRLAELDSMQVKAWLESNAAKRPTFVANSFRKLRAFLNWCSEQKDYVEITHVDACSARVSKNRLPKSKPKTDCLQREQLQPWFEQVKQLSSPTVSAYLQILLLTGARREEMATLKWSNVDLRWHSMTIKDKVEGERTIPITPYVESLLLAQKEDNETPPPPFRILHGKKIPNDLEGWSPSEWVFASKTSESGRMVEPRIGHNRAIEAAGLPSLTLHGLRRSFGTLAEWVECPVGISAQIMGHKPSAIAEKHYRQRPLDLLRMWHTRIETWILEQAGIVLLSSPH